MQRRRAPQCRLDVQADVLAADVLVEFGLVHQLRRLFRCAAEDQGAPAPVQSVRQLLEGPQPGGVDGGHVAQAHDDDRRECIGVIENAPDLVARSEQKGSMDAKHADVVGEMPALEAVDPPRFDVWALGGGGGGCYSRATLRGLSESHYSVFAAPSAKAVGRSCSSAGDHRPRKTTYREPTTNVKSSEHVMASLSSCYRMEFPGFSRQTQ
jgi:hypothetical protein